MCANRSCRRFRPTLFSNPPGHVLRTVWTFLSDFAFIAFPSLKGLDIKNPRFGKTTRLPSIIVGSPPLRNLTTVKRLSMLEGGGGLFKGSEVGQETFGCTYVRNRSPLGEDNSLFGEKTRDNA